MQYKVFLFDVDGVLVNSHQFQANALQKSFKQHILAANLAAIPPSHEALLRILVGGTEETAIPAIFKLVPELQEQMPAVINDAWELFYEAMNHSPEQFAIKPTVKLLRQLHSSGYTVRLVSNSKRADILRYCKVLDLIFILDDEEKYITSRESTSKPKPSPEVYQRACINAHADPSECIVFEDSHVGVQAGRAAGMYVIGLSSEYSSNNLLRTHGADEVVSNFWKAKVLHPYVGESMNEFYK